ncbi:MAG: hypothetical protein NTW54_02215 [Bacteroidetes bacterium]|nr:hypothetical protein [Bacteroidota bacterium]
MKTICRISASLLLLVLVNSCHETLPQNKKQSAQFIAFVKNFDTLSLPLILSNPNFLKQHVYQFQTLKKINPKEMYEFMKMDSLIPYPVYYFGQLPMMDSIYYLINYFEVRDKNNPSMWWTLMKFDYYGSLLSETQLSYCLKDSDEIRERFCKITPNYQCFYLETTGIWDERKQAITDTVLHTKTINLTYDQNR